MDIFFNQELILFAGLTLSFLGKVLLGVTVIMVHWKIIQEHKIDGQVLKEMRRERNVAILGIILIALGYLFEITFFEFLPFSECGFVTPTECALLMQLEPGNQ